jgi:predicted N-acetyltransferase YhbS
MHIRSALPRDVPALDRIALEAKAHWGYSQAQIDGWRADLATRPETVASWPTFVAEVDGDVVGFAQIDPTTTPWELISLFVEPCRMGQGIGAELVRKAMLNAHQSGIEVLHIDADPNALGFYRSFGAQEVAAVPAPIENAPDRVRPQLRLPTRGA